MRVMKDSFIQQGVGPFQGAEFDVTQYTNGDMVMRTKSLRAWNMMKEAYKKADNVAFYEEAIGRPYHYYVIDITKGR